MEAFKYTVAVVAAVFGSLWAMGAFIKPLAIWTHTLPFGLGFPIWMFGVMLCVAGPPMLVVLVAYQMRTRP